MLRALLQWSTEALKGGRGTDYDGALRTLGEALPGLLRRYPGALLERDALVRNLVEQAAGRPALAAVFLEFYREVLGAGYRLVRDRLDVPGWVKTQGGGLTDPTAVARQFAPARQAAHVGAAARA